MSCWSRSAVKWGCVVLCRGQWRVVSVFRRPWRRGSGVGRSSGTPLLARQVSGPGTNARPRLGALVRRPWAPQWGTPGRPKDPVRGLGSPPPPTQEVPQVSNRIWDQGLIRVWEYSGKDIRSIGQRCKLRTDVWKWFYWIVDTFR